MNWYKKSMDYAPFLASGETAWDWAKENVDIKYTEEDVTEDPNNDYIAAVVETSRDLAYSYSERYHSVKDKGSVTIYRAIKVNSLGDIDWKNVGTHWSFEKSSAGVYGNIPHGMSKSAITVILSGVVSPEHIDWEYCFTSFMYYGEDQWECALDEDSPIIVVAIDDNQISPIIAKA